MYENVEISRRWSKQDRNTVILDKCGGSLMTNHMTPGVEMVRLHLRRDYGTWEAVAVMLSENLNQKASGRERVAKHRTVADWLVVVRKVL